MAGKDQLSPSFIFESRHWPRRGEKMTSEFRSLIPILLLGTCLVSPMAQAGGNPTLVERPAAEHHFFDRKNVGLQCLSIAAMAADIATTRQALQAPGTREINPLATSTGNMLVLKIAGVGAGLGMAYLMHRTGHHKIERAIPMLLGAPSALAAVHNAGISR